MSVSVYVLEVGEYDDREVVGVYVSLKGALAAHKPTIRGDWRLETRDERPYYFFSGVRAGDTATVTKFELRP